MKNKDYKDITLLLTIYSYKIEEMNFWLDFYSQYKAIGGKLHFLIDNPKINELNFDKVEKEDIFYATTVRGKLSRVYKHIKANKVKTEFFKTVDPDDFISIEHLKKLVIKENNSIVKFPKRVTNLTIFNEFENNIELSIKNSNSIIGEENMWDKKFKEVTSNRITFDTSTTILPTRPILNDIFFSKLYLDTFLNFAEDQILGLIAYINNDKLIEYIDHPFYLYIDQNGFSGHEHMAKNFDKVVDDSIFAMSFWIEIFKYDNQLLPNSIWPVFESYNMDIDYYVALYNKYNKIPFNNESASKLKEIFTKVKNTSTWKPGKI